jgi:hypothetical protein
MRIAYTKVAIFCVQKHSSAYASVHASLLSALRSQVAVKSPLQYWFHTSYLASISNIADHIRKRRFPGIPQSRCSGELDKDPLPNARPVAPGWVRAGPCTAALMLLRPVKVYESIREKSKTLGSFSTTMQQHSLAPFKFQFQGRLRAVGVAVALGSAS